VVGGRDLSQTQHFICSQAALIPSPTTGRAAIKDLLAEGLIQRIRKGAKGNPYRYFAAAPMPYRAAKPETSKDKNKILLQTLRGEDASEEK
jgi:hypothetical protein